MGLNPSTDRTRHAPAIPIPSPASVRLPTVQVAKRYGVVSRTIERWQQDGRLGFPPPLTVNGRKYWPLEALEAWERARAAMVRGASDQPA